MTNRMVKWFDGEHLDADLEAIVDRCRDLAEDMDLLLKESAEKTTGLRKLLEAKDCFVRAGIESRVQE